METKTESLNKLFDKWEQVRPQEQFVRDGIINEDLFNKAKTKILFIAKEPNDPEQKENWDFRELWKNEVKYSFTYRIIEWSECVLNTYSSYDNIWLGNEKKDKKNGLQLLGQIAFMNIKKSGGNGSSDNKKLKKYIAKDYKLLHEEIEIISPDVIITGLSFLLEELFKGVNFKKSGHGVYIGKYRDSKIIHFLHPSSRTSPPAAYSLLKTVYASEQFKNL